MIEPTVKNAVILWILLILELIGAYFVVQKLEATYHPVAKISVCDDLLPEHIDYSRYKEVKFTAPINCTTTKVWS